MSESRAFLFEIGTEELPPKSLKNLANVFQTQLLANLEKNNLIDAAFNSKVFATPRRIAVLIDKVLTKQPDQVIDRRGPAVNQAFDEDGKPTQAAIGFAGSVGLEVGELQRQKTDKGEWLFCQIKQAGNNAELLIPECVEAALKALPIPKRMRWGTLDAEFIRPVKWIVMIYGDKVIDAEILSVKSDRHSYGHRFHSSRRLRLRHAIDYEELLLQDGLVVPDFDQRRQLILEGINDIAQEKQGQVLLDDALLNEVTGLVELPVPLAGSIDEVFMKLPQEVLISSMQDHQKYFPVVDDEKKMLPYFITVSNIRSKDSSSVVEGNERVLRARLSDAQFFFNSDQKTPLDQRVASLASVLFHKKLGTLGDKVVRVSRLGEYLAQQLGCDPKVISRSAQLCKTDLLTDMVGEFPDLQGVMGKYYALNDGELPAVATAIEQHYWPRFAGDAIPQSDVGQVLALADKLDTICGIFAANEAPSGDRDPFGLRRSALGILRILLEAELDLDLKQAIAVALDGYADLSLESTTGQSVYNFIFERLKTYYQSQGFDTREYQAVAAVSPSSPLDFDLRIRAVNAFSKLDAAQTLIDANKRIGNILQKTKVINAKVNPADLHEPQEIKLYDQLCEINKVLNPMINENRYADILETLTQLKQAVDEFFDDVMVMDEDPVKRDNRIALLNQIKELFGMTADISFLK